MKGPAAVADFVISSFDLLSPPETAAEIITRVGNANDWFSSVQEAAEASERWKSRVVKRLQSTLTQLREDSHPARFDFNASAPELIQGHCYPSDADSADLLASKLARSHSDAYRDAVRALSPRQFEAVCRGVLLLIGCDNPSLTKSSGDQGIDVFGEFAMTGRLSVRYHLGGPDALMNSWIIGQAKLYTGTVGPEEIRSFIGAHELARHGISYDNGAALAALQAKPYQAVHLFFLTTGAITRGAWTLARHAGIIIFDEDTVATLLADHQVATVNNTFVGKDFKSWIASQS
jgi:restriction endonuclease Mrr